jgi:hypothetical protein
MFLKKFVRKLFPGTETEPHVSAEECIIANRLRELMEVTSPALIDTSLSGEGTGERIEA